MTQFGMLNVKSWFSTANYHAPNLSRLQKNIEKSRSFVNGTMKGMWKLHAVDLDALQAEYPGLLSTSEEIVSTDTILPLPVYDKSRGFIESLAKQINASYEYNIFDGCAVLMRRLIEVLLILSYEHNGIEAEIHDTNGHYAMLERIIAHAKNQQKLKLSRDCKSLLDEIRPIGNFAAHKIYYNTRRSDLQRITGSYRAAVEELLYKSGIRI
ncbi:DUF4145 domain-containing protein [Variovorax paradoxus]|nr:DUF4145 domain-containing protein [Variovorax paradoxus]